MSDRQSTNETLPSEWRVIDLSAMIAPESSITYGVVQPGQEVVDGIPFVRGGDIYGGKIAIHKLRTISSSISSAYRRTLLRGGELLMSLVGYPGEVAVVPSELAGANIARQAALIRLDRLHDAKYVMYFLLSDLGKQRIFEQSNGSAQQVVNLADLKHVRVTLPPLPQQRKIARILTTVDNLIEKTEALIAKYQAIKQGMMHDLFTRGVDEHGHLRPPYEEAPELYKQSELGWIPKEWDDPRISSILVHRPKNGYSPKESNEWTGVLMLGLGCLTPHGFEPVQLKHAPRNDPNVASALLRNGDLLISRSNTRDLVALVGRYRDVGVPCIYSDLMMRLVPTEAILPDYMEAVLRHAPVRRQLTNASCGTSGSMMKINSEMVLNTVIVLPKKHEQRAILDRVESINRFILKARNELAKHKEAKTGLMQDLLTGKVRVKLDEAEEVAAHA